MDKLRNLKTEFNNRGGVMKTSELKELGLSSRQIKKLLQLRIIDKIRQGYYELAGNSVPEEVILARLFPEAVIFLESALLHYGYTDRIPFAWQLAVNKDSTKSIYDIPYPIIQPFYIEGSILGIGVDTFESEGLKIRIYDRDRTICDILRYENKLEREVFTKAIKSYIADDQKNIRNLLEYSERLNIKNKVKTFIGAWV